MTTAQRGPWNRRTRFRGGGERPGKDLAGAPLQAAWEAAQDKTGAVPGQRQRRRQALGREGSPPWRRSGRLFGAAGAAVRPGAREGNFQPDPNQGTQRRVGDQGFPPGVVLRPGSGRTSLGLLCLRHLDLPAQPAGMLPVESLLDGHRHAAGALRVIVEHFHPGDGLQHGPVTTRNREEGERREKEAEPTEHEKRIGAISPRARFNVRSRDLPPRPIRLRASAPGGAGSGATGRGSSGLGRGPRTPPRRR